MNATERGIREQFPLWSKVSQDVGRPEAGTVHVVVGCGTSVHIADSIADTLNRKGFFARAVAGNEWTRRPGDYVPTALNPRILALSRSGKSTETVAAAAASLMLLMGLRYAGISVTPSTTSTAEKLLNDIEPRLAEMIAGRTHFVFLGGGALYGVAREGSLKLQEMSLSQTEAHHPLEYRHGPISLIDENSLVIFLYHPETLEEESLLATELMAKGARVIGIGGPGTISMTVKSDAETRPLVVLPALQMLGEYVARAKGLDTLAPRHLTKVVTIS